MSAPYGKKASWIRRDNLSDLNALDVIRVLEAEML